jgi:hypothetical protein
MRIFGSERMDGMLQKLGLKEGEADHPSVDQQGTGKGAAKVEARNFDIRKNLLKFDDVMNDQRKVVFEQRKELMDSESISETVRTCATRSSRPGQAPHSRTRLRRPMERYGAEEGRAGLSQSRSADRSVGRRRGHRRRRHPRAACVEIADKAAAERAERFGPEITTYVEKSVVADARHVLARAPGQSRPSALGRRFPRLCAARSAAGIQAGGFELFQAMLANLRQAVTAQLMRVEVVREAERRRRNAGRWKPITPTRRRATTSSPAGAEYGRRRQRYRLRAEDRDPERSVHMGQGRPQRGVSHAAQARSTSIATAPTERDMSNHKSGRDRDIDPGLFRACRQADANRGQTAEAVYALKPRQVIGHCDFKFEYRHLGPVGTAGVPTAGQTVS